MITQSSFLLFSASRKVCISSSLSNWIEFISNMPFRVTFKLTPFAALACRALRRLFSSAVDRLSHAEANIDRGTHFLVGSGIIDCGRSDVETVGSGNKGVEGEGSHRSVLISWNRFPLLDPAVDEIGGLTCLDLTAGLVWAA